ncbi:SDR family NAD(P)-dependent oxidoreductase [Pediococcus ethanolidurans]|uniref:Short chain dehydrogenase n=1 Tax=Pediococcus ethanolidurans TaxID=319653 RepID=A0A0R2K1E6_9LACO|nr:SDR family NAD(P)-dependent oxidoreductase [Pediococcus ethanolidurans]KRN83426.1 short-chain dehydrogenase reductase SDR [Pediococcus ethanolidurans]GEN94472.1 hypothetical protein PET01_05220 [Pediococcus ethanolidurans]SER23854.1 short chain dehydrogenase [Pediococcus ethanolidurans]
MKKVMIMGVGPGFGLALAQKFGEQGNTIVLVARNSGRLTEYQEELAENEIKASCHAVDVTKHEQVQQLFQDESEVDTLIYNVGNTALDDPLTSSLDDIKATFETNVLGCIDACQQFVNTKRPQTILVTGGGAALHPSALTTTLSLTKAALRSYVLSLHDVLKEKGIYVGLLTIQGIADVGAAMQPIKVANAYVEAAQQRNNAEIFYPNNQGSKLSEFEQLQQLAKDPKTVEKVLKNHPEFAKYLDYFKN